ncbi:MAG: hypothetical protein NT031_10815, partial [Planctomycetota bacterium]|nr:hypothetical protein [Planctomycetota bacterium]
LGILTTTLAVSLSGRHDEHAIRITAEDLAAAIQFAAQRARTTGRPYRVAFLGGMTGYRIEQAQTAGGTDFEPVGGLAGQTRQLLAGVRVASVDRGPQASQGSNSDLEYDGAGGGFCGSIRLTNRTGQNITIQVLPYTGQVYVVN